MLGLDDHFCENCSFVLVYFSLFYEGPLYSGFCEGDWGYGLSFYLLVIAHVPRKFLRERTRERGFGITLNTRDQLFDFNVIQEIRRFMWTDFFCNLARQIFTFCNYG